MNSELYSRLPPVEVSPPTHTKAEQFDLPGFNYIASMSAPSIRNTFAVLRRFIV